MDGFWSSLTWTDPYTVCTRPTPATTDAETFFTIHRIDHEASMAERSALCDFLATYFGDPPRTPVFSVTPEELLQPEDDLYVATHRRSEVIGCVRYRWIGTDAHHGRKVHLVDAFCVHPAYRGTGIGRALLSELHRDANRRGVPYALFLKEGAALSWWIRPAYSGMYVYRDTATVVCPSSVLQSLPTPLAHQLLRLYSHLYPDTFVLFPSHERNQIWKQYRVIEDRVAHNILICIQDTYQQKDGQRMGWITAWLESAQVTDAHRVQAAEQVCNALASTYRYLWFNREWVPILSVAWKQDGGFQWYTFQWSTEIRGKSYCLLHGG